MLFMYTAVILFILTIAFFKGKNMLFWSLGSYLISASIILISLLVYNIMVSVNYSLPANILEKAGYYLVFHLKLHITDVVTLYNFGNFLLLSSAVIFLIISGKKITPLKLLLFVPPAIYFILNHPRIKYNIWNYCMIYNRTNPFSRLVIFNSLLLVVYFMLPVIQLCRQYFKTQIFSKRKYVLGTLVYILIIEITMGLVLHVNIYSNYYPLRYDVNSMPTVKTAAGVFNPMFSINSRYTEFFLVAAIVILLYILTCCDFSTTFNVVRPPRRENRFKRENDEMLKTIFHTYKNAFFAIERFGSILESKIDPNDKMSVAALKNIQDISHSSFINSKKMIDSVILTYDFSSEKVRLDLTEMLDDLLLQFEGTENLTLQRDFSEEEIFINGSYASLREAFTNILNNAVEATAEVENPTVKISLFTEGSSAVINFRDNGCGIKKNEIKNIFRPLYSNKNSSNNFGIGLSTALKTINYHSGTILCKSKPNEYTIFQVILPLVK